MFNFNVILTRGLLLIFKMTIPFSSVVTLNEFDLNEMEMS